jgi:hypothetical protein
VTLVYRRGWCASTATKILAVPFRRTHSRGARGARDRRQDGPDFANQLLRRFVHTDHSGAGARQRRVEAEHVLHARHVRGINLRHAPHLCLPRFEVILRQAAADGRTRNAWMWCEPHDFRGKQRQCPAPPPGGGLRAS